jgi:hypothetical protein
MLNFQLLVDRGQLAGEVVQGIGFLSVGQLWADAALRIAKLLNLPHGAMHGAELTLKLRHQVELMRDEYFGVKFQRFKLSSPLLIHIPIVKNDPESRQGLASRIIFPWLYLIPTTIESGPARCSTKVFRKPTFFIHALQSAPE